MNKIDGIFSCDDKSGRKLVCVANDRGKISSNSTARSKSQMTSGISGNERSPLIRPPNSNDEPSDDTASEAAQFFPRMRVNYGSVPPQSSQLSVVERRCVNFQSLLKILSQPMASIFSCLILVIIGIVMVFAANLRTNPSGDEVKPKHVLIYIMLLISIFIIWMIFAVIPHKLRNPGRHDGTLIPRHLLTGVGIFGTVSATTQVLMLLDYIKCSQHVKGLSYVYGIYPCFKIAFIYFQIYFFYKFSRDGIRNSFLSGGVFFVMVTLATNLCIWTSAFFGDVSNNPKLKDVPWLNHYYFGIKNDDPCSNRSLTSYHAYKLHSLVKGLSPYISTFSMEYALLASGLLLHIWMLTRRRVPKVPKPNKQTWTLWRLGFIAGLMAIPIVFLAYFMNEEFNSKPTATKVLLSVLKGVFFILLLSCCFYSITLIDEKQGFVKKKRGMKLEVILLGISGFLGFPAFDLASIFAAFCEIENFDTVQVLWYAICKMCELLSFFSQFCFIKKAYQYKLPEVGHKTVGIASQRIRQFASFAAVLNIAYWAAHTYELRNTSASLTIGEKYFGRYSWFGLSHVCLPLCLFFYFHIAICYANVVSSVSQFGPLWNHDKQDKLRQ
ncbi:proton channel OtopLc-like [Xenia sp. Carnegie-2017]|uniref:proton channel OtopLc-like n=1 Tax=Xenia sp. Carnegie-2017 TaxID=2897299 RepID=UPI001F037E2B|nr:proton channel OtopLc-like [Xenia sp. Carnegie-2017]